MHLYAVISCAIILTTAAIEVQDLPPDIQADLYLAAAQQEIADQQWATANHYLRWMIHLEVPPPAGFALAQAQVQAQLGEPNHALTAVLACLLAEADNESAVAEALPIFMHIKNDLLPPEPVPFPPLPLPMQKRLLTTSAAANEDAHRWTHAVADYAQLEDLAGDLTTEAQFCYGRALVNSGLLHEGLRRLNHFLSHAEDESLTTQAARDLRIQANTELEARQVAWDKLAAQAVPDATYANLEHLYYGSEQAQQRQRQAVTSLGLPLEIKTARSGIVMRLIPSGRFKMGSPDWEQGHQYNEQLHDVILTRPFYFARLELTNHQWLTVTNDLPVNNEPAGGDSDTSKEGLTIAGVQAFLEKLCEVEGVPPGTFRLPTEAEWEYVARAGTYTPLPSPNVNLPNAWGVCEMHTDSREWCADWYGDYSHELEIDPKGPSHGIEVVIRGGQFNRYKRPIRSAERRGQSPVITFRTKLRVVRDLPPSPLEPPSNQRATTP